MEKRTNCLNCVNFKSRIINFRSLQRRKETSKFRQFYQFPTGVGLLNRLQKEKKCEIYYCKMLMMRRELYLKNNSVQEYNPLVEPCVFYT